MKAISLFFRFAWILCVFVPLPAMAQVGNAADAGAVPPDQPVKPTPSLRLLASEPDLASLPRPPLATAADRPAAQSTQSARVDRSTQANRDPEEAPPPASLVVDPLSPEQRIASLPTVPAASPPAAQAPRQASARAVSLPDIAKALRINLSAPWLRMAAIGLLVVAVVGLFWRLGKRNRPRPAIDDTAPIDWAIAADSKEGLGKMLRAEREKAAQQARASQQRARFASLGEALTAMKADMQRSATRRRPRAVDV